MYSQNNDSRPSKECPMVPSSSATQTHFKTGRESVEHISYQYERGRCSCTSVFWVSFLLHRNITPQLWGCLYFNTFQSSSINLQTLIYQFSKWESFTGKLVEKSKMLILNKVNNYLPLCPFLHQTHWVPGSILLPSFVDIGSVFFVQLCDSRCSAWRLLLKMQTFKEHVSMMSEIMCSNSFNLSHLLLPKLQIEL